LRHLKVAAAATGNQTRSGTADYITEKGTKMNNLIDNIKPLEREKWQNYMLPFRYTSYNYHDVEIVRCGDNFTVSFVKKLFAEPFVHNPDDTDKLFQPHWEKVMAWGIVEDGQIVAAIETAAEEWSNRLLVTELWIDEAYRRRGIGTALMNLALGRAKDEKRRVLMLETQSRNENAIAFYLAWGLTLIGFDACCYSNSDLERKEVRLEMGLLLDYEK